MLDCRKKKKKKKLVCILQKSPLVLVPAHKSLSEIAFLYKKLYFLQEDELMYGLEQQLFVAKLFSFVAKREGWLALGMFNFVPWYANCFFAQVVPFKVDFAFPESVYEVWDFAKNETKIYTDLISSFLRSSFFWTIPEHVDFAFFDLSIMCLQDKFFCAADFVVSVPQKFSFARLLLPFLEMHFIAYEKKLFSELDFVYFIFFSSKREKYLKIYSQYLFDYPVLGQYLDDYLFRYAVWYDYSKTFL